MTTVQPLCTASPAATFWQYGLLAPFLAILLLAILGQYSSSTVSDTAAHAEYFQYSLFYLILCTLTPFHVFHLGIYTYH